jgi:hypothetical protein
MTPVLEEIHNEWHHLYIDFYRRLVLSSSLSAAKARHLHLNALILSGDKKKRRRHHTIRHASGGDNAEPQINLETFSGTSAAYPVSCHGKRAPCLFHESADHP